MAVDQIREIRYGVTARPSTSASNALPSSVISPAATARWISIVYVLPSTSWKNLNMIALNDEILDLWIRTLYDLVNDFKQVSYFRLDDSCGSLSSAESLPSGLTPEVSLGKAGIIGIIGTKDDSISGCNPRPIRLDSVYNRALSASQTFGDLEVNNSEKMVTLTEVIAMCRKIGLSQKFGQSQRTSSTSGKAGAQETLGNNIGLIEMYFRSIDQTQRGFLDFEQFRAIVKMIKSNSDIADVWSTLCSAVDDGAAAGISEEMFIRWMRTNQGVSHFWLRLEASIINYQVAIYLIVTSF